ncbi:MAG: cation-translocating P-type ATPase [Desulfobacteraceae bacterium]|nr:MAG: cation-translocating P-type ATPase [Desulfobacteraceae bacterium]
MKVIGDQRTVSRPAIIQVVEKAGHKVEAEDKTKSAVLHIEGMDCEDEVSLIEKKMKSLKGLESFQVDLISEALRVQYDPGLLSVQEIIKSIAETGMKARLEREKVKGKAWWKDPRILSLFVCGISTLAAFLLESMAIAVPSTILYAVAVAVGGYYPARMGLAALRTLTLNIRTLMVAGAIGAIVLGLWEEAAVLVFIYSLGDVLEAYAVDRARGALKALMELMPKEAVVRRNDEEITLPVEEVHPGESILIKPGERIPLDGLVISGSSAVDEAPITGEPIPVVKEKGAEVFAGTVNQRGILEVKVTKISNDTILARIIHSVEEAQAKKSSFQRFGEAFGRIYTPAMFVLALLVIGVPVLFFNGVWSEWFYRGLVVLVVSCSCGIALSIPVAVVAAIGNAARNGILFKGGIHLERAATIQAIAFDKTGTLTIGRPRVTDVVVLANRPFRDILALAASLECRSEHPLGEAIVRKAREEEIPFTPAETFEALVGRGAKGIVNGQESFTGGMRLFLERKIPIESIQPIIASLEEKGKTAILVGSDKEIFGIIAISDQLRREARETIQRLKGIGIRQVIMLTGDNEGTARAVAEESGADTYFARLLPEDKVERINRLREENGRIAMVGDGINDAPAMAVSDLGIAMGAAGTDIALETADIALMSDDLSKLPVAFNLSRRTVSNIRQNIIISLAVIAFLVPAALAGWIGMVPGLLINEAGGLAVIINGLRLLRG